MTMAAVNVQAMVIMPHSHSHSPALAQRSVEPLPRLPDAPPPGPPLESSQGRKLAGQQPGAVAVGVGVAAGAQSPRLEPGTSFLSDIRLIYAE
jgi:hypothetical protein